MSETTYWNHDGRFQSYANILERLVPRSGPVQNPHKNPALEKFRRAVNVYYDIFNNGLGGRQLQSGKDFRVFGFGYTQYIRRSRPGRDSGFEFMPSFYPRLEEQMDRIIAAAAIEQNIVQ